MRVAVIEGLRISDVSLSAEQVNRVISRADRGLVTGGTFEAIELFNVHFKPLVGESWLDNITFNSLI